MKLVDLATGPDWIVWIVFVIFAVFSPCRESSCTGKTYRCQRQIR